jgi:hypothetical protein
MRPHLGVGSKWLVVACAGLVGCSSASKPSADGSCGTSAYPCVCGGSAYPSGTYGTAVGDTAANLCFQGYADADEQCQQNSAKQLDASKLTDLSFQQFYVGDPSKSCKRKLLWVMVSAGWCTSCQDEVKKVRDDYASGALDNRVAVLNVVLDNQTLGTRADRAFLDKWVATFKMTFPVAIDPQFSLRGYTDGVNLPFSTLLDLSNMHVFYGDVGEADDVYGQIKAFFSKTP